MLKITVNILCVDGYAETFSDADDAESFLEGLVTLRLMEFFEFLNIEGVSATRISELSAGKPVCLLSVDASGLALSLEPVEVLALRIEDALCCALIELFSNIHVLTLHIYQEQEMLPELATLAQVFR